MIKIIVSSNIVGVNVSLVLFDLNRNKQILHLIELEIEIVSIKIKSILVRKVTFFI